MNSPSYSSLTAFIAHWRALREAPSLNPEQSARLGQMREVIETLSAAERDALALQEGAIAGDAGRHRQRAERHLNHLLRHRGWLAA